MSTRNVLLLFGNDTNILSPMDRHRYGRPYMVESYRYTYTYTYSYTPSREHYRDERYRSRSPRQPSPPQTTSRGRPLSRPDQNNRTEHQHRRRRDSHRAESRSNDHREDSYRVEAPRSQMLLPPPPPPHPQSPHPQKTSGWLTLRRRPLGAPRIPADRSRIWCQNHGKGHD